MQHISSGTLATCGNGDLDRYMEPIFVGSTPAWELTGSNVSCVGAIDDEPYVGAT